MGGKGIIIDIPEKIKNIVLNNKYDEYLLQEFVDTSNGIPNITQDKHDLRIIIVNGKIVLAHVRNPKKGSLLANVAQGGQIYEVPISNLPQTILKAVEIIQNKIDRNFFYPIYSIDFGVDKNGRPYVFELNDQIGFPKEDMPSAKLFAEAVFKSLQKKAQDNEIKAS